MGYSVLSVSRFPSGRRLGPETALELAGTVLDAVSEPAAWEGFVRRFGELMRGAAPGLFLHDGGQRVLEVTAGYDPIWQRAYDEYYVTRDVRRPRIRALPAGTVYIGQELASDDELCASEFYNDFLRPLGYFHALGAVLLKEEGRVGVLRVMRPRSRPFGEQERSFLRLLLPHLARGLAVHERLNAARAERDAHAEVVDRLGGGVVFLDRSGHVLSANRFAEDVLRSADGLLAVHGSLIASAPRDGVVLRRLIDAVASRDPRQADSLGGALVVQRPSRRAPYHVLVSPLAAAWLATAPRQAAVVVYVTDPERGPESDRDAVCRYLGLTPAEGGVVLALSRGLSLADVARERGISLETVRTHVKRSLAKADVRRQADLVRLVLSGPSGLGLRRG
jgi:DNA-binding CsgD family transcriptional regulator/PAS domain-containing protein